MATITTVSMLPGGSQLSLAHILLKVEAGENTRQDRPGKEATKEVTNGAGKGMGHWIPLSHCQLRFKDLKTTKMCFIPA